jgi:chorismate-pyruvate lyase
MSETRIKYSMDFGADMLQRLKDFETKIDRRISPMEKALLSEIGTVEQLLSLIVDSPIHIAEVEEEAKNNWVLRTVWLCNTEGKKLLWARTEYYIPRIPPEVYKAIHNGRGIGSALMHYNIDCRRRITQFGYDMETNSVWRIYEIMHGTEVWFEITEQFELNSIAPRITREYDS